MSKIAQDQSRRNVARRRRRVAARHRPAGHWSPQPAPMLTAGPVHYEVGGNVDATCFGGIAALHQLVVRLGLPAAIDADLELLKVHLPYHESDHVLNLAYNVACGGTRLEDIERLRHDTAYMNALGADLIPDPTTAGDFCRRFTTTDDVTTLMDAINTVRPKLWTSRGRDLLGPVAYIDVDATITPTTGSRKDGMNMSYKGIWGYHPLLISPANTREVLYLVNRPGNVPSHAGAADRINKAIDLVAPSLTGTHRTACDANTIDTDHITTDGNQARWEPEPSKSRGVPAPGRRSLDAEYSRSAATDSTSPPPSRLASTSLPPAR